MGVIASQITSLTIVYSTIYSDADQRKHQSSASLAFVWGPVNSPHKWPVTRKMFPFDDVVMLWCECHTSRKCSWKLNNFYWFNNDLLCSFSMYKRPRQFLSINTKDLSLNRVYLFEINSVFAMIAVSFGSLTPTSPGLILGLRPANERRRYKVTLSLIGWAQT